MSEWMTAQEIADARLPGLPTSKRRVNDLAQEEVWATRLSPLGEPLARARKGRGGGAEYHVSLLPPAARSELKARVLKAATAPALPPTPGPSPRGGGEPSPHELKERDVLRRDARLMLLSLADAHYAANRALGTRGADEGFAAAYNAGRIETPEWVRREVAYASRRSLARWRSMRDDGRWHDVATGYARRARACVLQTAEDGAVARYIGGLLVKQPFLTAHHVRDLIEARFGAELATPSGAKPLPSPRAFQRWICDWKSKNGVALQALTDPDAFKGSKRLSGSNAYAFVNRLNQLWEIDASPADVLCADGRFNLYVVVDVWSRRMMGYISRTARTEAALLLTRRAILAWGVPETLRTDNGSDFTSHHFVRALISLGIRQDVTAPFSPEQKGLVERHIHTMQHGLMPLLPGFIGHNVAERKQIEGRKAFAARLGESADKAFCVDLTAGELQAAIDDWCTDKYQHRAHGGLAGQSPFQRLASHTGAVRRIENQHALDLLLAPVAGSDGYRTVTKQGIRLDGAYYLAPEIMPGTRVFCRQDPEDYGTLYAFEGETGAFLGEAICSERAGIDPRAAVQAAREAQADLIRSGTAEIRREAARIKPRDMIDGVLGLARDKQANLAQFPQRSTGYTTRDLDAAGDATSGPPAAPSPALPQEGGGSATEREGSTANVVPLPETATQRFRRALELRAAIDGGADVPADQALWLGGYETSPEFRARAAMLADFGEASLNE